MTGAGDMAVTFEAPEPSPMFAHLRRGDGGQEFPEFGAIAEPVELASCRTAHSPWNALRATSSLSSTAWCGPPWSRRRATATTR